MLTPQEVSKKTFPRASFNGYNMTAVDEFLDTLTEDYGSLYKENATLKAKLKVLAEKVEEYRATEDAMRSTLLTAQRMAAQLVQDAQTEKEQILANARIDAAAEIGRLAEEKSLAEQKLALAQKELAAFVQRSRDLCIRQAEFLTQLPEMEIPAAKEDPVPQDTVQMIGAGIVRGFAAAQEEAAKEEAAAPAEEAVEERVEETVEAAPAQEAEEDNPFPADFKLDLDELKFGRNYSGE